MLLCLSASHVSHLSSLVPHHRPPSSPPALDGATRQGQPTSKAPHARRNKSFFGRELERLESTVPAPPAVRLVAVAGSEYRLPHGCTNQLDTHFQWDADPCPPLSPLYSDPSGSSLIVGSSHPRCAVVSSHPRGCRPRLFAPFALWAATHTHLTCSPSARERAILCLAVRRTCSVLALSSARLSPPLAPVAIPAAPQLKLHASEIQTRRGCA